MSFLFGGDSGTGGSEGFTREGVAEIRKLMIAPLIY